MIKTLYKLGILKFNFEQFLDHLKVITDELAELFIDTEGLVYINKHKSKCEIKTFLWIYSSPIFEETLPKRFFDQTMEYFSHEVIFNSVDESEMDNIFKSKFIKTRIAFHDEGINKMAENNYEQYFRELKTIWIHKTFIEIRDINKPYQIRFDPIINLKEDASIRKYITIMIPSYMKILKDYIRFTKFR